MLEKGKVFDIMFDKGKVFERIDQLTFRATKTEKDLIKGLREIPISELVCMSISDLAEQLSVAEATILRFCRKLDYKGFQDFKLSLGRDYANEKPDLSEQSKTQQIAGSMCSAIMQTLAVVDYKVIEALAAKICMAKRICIFGVGNSFVATIAAKNRLMKAGIIAENSPDIHTQTMTAANLNKDDLVILISVSGGTKDIINIAELARENDTPVAVITNYPKSPLGKLANYLIHTSRKEAAYEGGSLTTVVCQHYIVDVLCSEVFNVIGKSAAESSVRASSAVSSKSL